MACVAARQVQVITGMPQLLHKVAHGREDDVFLAAIRHAVGLGSDWKNNSSMLPHSPDTAMSDADN